MERQRQRTTRAPLQEAYVGRNPTATAGLQALMLYARRVWSGSEASGCTLGRTERLHCGAQKNARRSGCGASSPFFGTKRPPHLTSRTSVAERKAELKHDLEKCVAVFRKDHAPTKT